MDFSSTGLRLSTEISGHLPVSKEEMVLVLFRESLILPSPISEIHSISRKCPCPLLASAPTIKMCTIIVVHLVGKEADVKAVEICSY